MRQRAPPRHHHLQREIGILSLTGALRASDILDDQERAQILRKGAKEVLPLHSEDQPSFVHCSLLQVLCALGRNPTCYPRPKASIRRLVRLQLSDRLGLHLSVAVLHLHLHHLVILPLPSFYQNCLEIFFKKFVNKIS